MALQVVAAWPKPEESPANVREGGAVMARAMHGRPQADALAVRALRNQGIRTKGARRIFFRAMVNNPAAAEVEACVTENYETMKKLITAIAIGAFAFAGTAIQADARPHGGRGYHAPASTVYVSGYRHGRPVYTEKYFVGYDRHGRPRFAYRTVGAPRRHHVQHCEVPARYGRGHDHYDRRRSGASVSFHFGR